MCGLPLSGWKPWPQGRRAGLKVEVCGEKTLSSSRWLNINASNNTIHNNVSVMCAYTWLHVWYDCFMHICALMCVLVCWCTYAKHNMHAYVYLQTASLCTRLHRYTRRHRPECLTALSFFCACVHTLEWLCIIQQVCHISFIQCIPQPIWLKQPHGN